MHSAQPPHSPVITRRRRSHWGENNSVPPRSPGGSSSLCSSSRKSFLVEASAEEKAQARAARKLNDSLVYLDGPQVYTCGQCRTHLTSHDEIISKSFHGRHGESKPNVFLCLLAVI